MRITLLLSSSHFTVTMRGSNTEGSKKRSEPENVCLKGTYVKKEQFPTNYEIYFSPQLEQACSSDSPRKPYNLNGHSYFKTAFNYLYLNNFNLIEQYQFLDSRKFSSFVQKGKEYGI